MSAGSNRSTGFVGIRERLLTQAGCPASREVPFPESRPETGRTSAFCCGPSISALILRRNEPINAAGVLDAIDPRNVFFSSGPQSAPVRM
jgi:hypothetical protein